MCSSAHHSSGRQHTMCGVLVLYSLTATSQASQESIMLSVASMRQNKNSDNANMASAECVLVLFHGKDRHVSWAILNW